MSTKIENQFKHKMGYIPEPMLSDEEMLHMIRTRRKTSPDKLNDNGKPLYLILSCEQTMPNPIIYTFGKITRDSSKFISHRSVIGKRTSDGKWFCAIFPDQIDPDIVDDIGEQLHDDEWIDVNEIKGLAEDIAMHLDPDFKPKKHLDSQVETLWEYSVDNEITHSDIFRQDDEAQ